MWGGKQLPRWSFILWLAVQQQLATKDRLRGWGMSLNDGYCLCGNREETHKHLFFECPYSLTIWQSLNFKGKGLRSISVRCSLAAAVNSLWKKSNYRTFPAKQIDQSLLAIRTTNAVRDFLRSRRRMKPSQTNKLLCEQWGLSENLWTRVTSLFWFFSLVLFLM